jgi:hypothetical protein
MEYVEHEPESAHRTLCALLGGKEGTAEVRKYMGWHHHMLTTMLAHFFLWHLKLRLGKKSSRVDGVTAADVVGRSVTVTDSDSR